MRQTLKLGFLVLVVAALAMSGLALAQTDGDPTVTDTPGSAGLVMERLAPLVDDGTLTEAQAEAVAGVLAEGSGPGRHHGPRGAGAGAVAEFLGIDLEDLRATLEEGATLAEVAEANGSSRADLIEFMVGEAEARLDEAVDSGRIDEAEKAEKLARITERIEARVDGQLDRPDGRPGHRRPGGPGDGFSPGGGGGTDV